MCYSVIRQHIMSLCILFLWDSTCLNPKSDTNKVYAAMVKFSKVQLQSKNQMNESCRSEFSMVHRIDFSLKFKIAVYSLIHINQLRTNTTVTHIESWALSLYIPGSSKLWEQFVSSIPNTRRRAEYSGVQMLVVNFRAFKIQWMPTYFGSLQYQNPRLRFRVGRCQFMRFSVVCAHREI